MPLARASRDGRGARWPGDPFASPLAWLRPIDSEHSAIWQCLVGESMDDGGGADPHRLGRPVPRRDAPSELAAVTPEHALRHPTWTMGAKITIDSATLANKGLEVIEAHWLYDVDYDAIEVVIHPQSVVHSAVRFRDGSLKAQLGTPDMRLPIQYALTYPGRLPSPAAAPDLIGDRPARLPRTRRDPVPRAPHRPRGGPDRVRGRRPPSSPPTRWPSQRFLAGHPVVHRHPGAARGRRGRASGGTATPSPDVEALVELDAAVRAAFARGPVGAGA